MAVVEEERRQEEEKGRENERNEWRIAAKREEDRRVLERTIAFEEASRLATVFVQRISACVTNKTDFQPELLQVLGS